MGNCQETPTFYDPDFFPSVFHIDENLDYHPQVQMQLNRILYQKLNPNSTMSDYEEREFRLNIGKDLLEVLKPNSYLSLIFDFECQRGYHLQKESQNKFRGDEHAQKMMKIKKILNMNFKEFDKQISYEKYLERAKIMEVGKKIINKIDYQCFRLNLLFFFTKV